MIEHLNGIILHLEGPHVVIEASGVGYGVDVTPRAAEKLAPVGSQRGLWVYTYVRDDAIDLYGFETRAERQAFEIMIGISGLGPKMALFILGAFSIDQLLQVVLAGDTKRLSGVPGIGPKRAEKLLVELKGRVKQLSAGLGADRLAEIKSGAGPEFSPLGPAAAEAVAALEALGIQPAQARKAAAKALEILGDDASTEALVREGLRHRHV